MSAVPDLYRRARDGHRRSLGRLLTMVERAGPDAEVISELAHPDSGQAHIVGITGSPGSGKSTLVGRLVSLLTTAGKRPAVLAVDPSSPLTGGAILGDRVRMYDHGGGQEDGADGAAPSAAFIRSMATRGQGGGLALAVPLAVRLLDAAGHDPVLIETVGVGQVEVDVVAAADTAVVVVPPGTGDAVQANKAGLLEVADVFVVNKADRPGAADVRRDLDLMLDLSHLTGLDERERPGSEHNYRPPIVMASAIDGTGVDEVWAAVTAHACHLDTSGLRAVRRQRRVRSEIEARLEQHLTAAAAELLAAPSGRQVLTDAEQGTIGPAKASAALMSYLLDGGQP